MKNKPIKNFLLSVAGLILATSILADQTIQANIQQPQIAPSTQPPQIQTTLSVPETQTQTQPPIIELQVNNQNEKERKQIFAKALEQILVQSSNNPTISTSSIIKTALSNPSIYVQRYTYIERDIAIGQPGLFLQIQFNQTAVTQLLQLAQTAQAKPTIDKQQTLVWLVKDTGSNKILEDDSSNDVIVPILKKNAQTFGLPIILPVSDLQDANRIQAYDICNLNTTTITAASKRYGTQTVITGCIKQPTTGNIWTSQWLLLRENRSDNFSFTGITADDVVMQAMQTLAPIIVNIRQQSESQAAKQSKKLTLRISNINGLVQHNEVVRYLSSFSQVSRVDLIKISPTEIELSVNTIGDKQTLLNALNIQNKLVKNTNIIASPPGIDLDYKWVTASNGQPQTISTKPLP